MTTARLNVGIAKNVDENHICYINRHPLHNRPLINTEKDPFSMILGVGLNKTQKTIDEETESRFTWTLTYSEHSGH